MSFLKKYWRFIIPALAVLCVILLSAFILYSNITPSDPKRVYLMPERNLDNPQSLNTGGIAITTSPGVAFAVREEVPIPADEDGSLDPCCPDELPDNADDSRNYQPQMQNVPPEVWEDGERLMEYQQSLKSHQRDYDALIVELDALERELLSYSPNLVKSLLDFDSPFFQSLDQETAEKIRQKRLKRYGSIVFKSHSTVEEEAATMKTLIVKLEDLNKRIAAMHQQMPVPPPSTHSH